MAITWWFLLGSNQPKNDGRGDILNYLKDFPSDVLQGLSIEGGLYDCYRITVSDKDVGQTACMTI